MRSGAAAPCDLCLQDGSTPRLPTSAPCGVPRADVWSGRHVQAEKKVNLGIGAYRDEAGKPWVLECVKSVSRGSFQGAAASCCRAVVRAWRAACARSPFRPASRSIKESLTKGKRRRVACVQAEKVLLDELNSGKINKEYLPVTGLQDFLNVTSQVCAPVYPSMLLHFCTLVVRRHQGMEARS